MRPRVVPWLVLGAVLLSSGTGLARTDAGQPTLDPGGFEERNVRMDADWSVTYNWSADAAVYFDVHSHQGAEVTYHVQNRSTDGTVGTFTAPSRRVYSVYWENRGQQDPVALTWSLDGRFLDLDEHFRDGESTPGFGPPLVGAAAAAAVVLARRHRSW